MVYAGVDVAKADHVIGAVGDDGASLARPMRFKNSEAGFDRCAAWLEGVAEDESGVVVGMEATGHYWMALFSFLCARGYRVCVVNPMQVHAVRRLKGMGRVKNDRVDSELIAETMRIGRFDETRLATDQVQSLRSLTRYHQSLRAEAAGAKTQLKCVLDAYFPEYEGLFSDMFGAASLAPLELCPLPADIAARRQATVSRTLSEASRGRLGDDKAAEVRAAARSSVGVTLGSAAASFQVRSLVRQVRFLEDEAAKVAAEVRRLLDEVGPLVLTIPGVSCVAGAQIVAEIGDIGRFRNAAALASYAGLNSSVSQSGKFDSGGGPITKHGSPYLRRALWLAASRAWQCDPRLGEFYRKKRAEGKPHRVAVTAAARKLCHIVYAVMRDREAYDPSR